MVDGAVSVGLMAGTGDNGTTIGDFVAFPKHDVAMLLLPPMTMAQDVFLFQATTAAPIPFPSTVFLWPPTAAAIQPLTVFFLPMMAATLMPLTVFLWPP